MKKRRKKKKKKKEIKRKNIHEKYMARGTKRELEKGTMKTPRTCTLVTPWHMQVA